MKNIRSTLTHNIEALLGQRMLASAVGTLKGRIDVDSTALEMLVKFVEDNFPTHPELFKFNLLQKIYRTLLEVGAVKLFARLFTTLSERVEDKRSVYPTEALVLGGIHASQQTGDEDSEQVFNELYDVV